MITSSTRSALLLVLSMIGRSGVPAPIRQARFANLRRLREPLVVGYYALASGAVPSALAPGGFRRKMPDPIPAAVLDRLAVDAAHHREGVGRALFRDAALRILNAADSIGIRGMLVHAISEEAKAFYLALGLVESPLEPMTLMVTLAQLRAADEAR